jgi:hypothetical protein
VQFYVQHFKYNTVIPIIIDFKITSFFFVIAKDDIIFTFSVDNLHIGHSFVFVFISFLYVSYLHEYNADFLGYLLYFYLSSSSPMGYKASTICLLFFIVDVSIT